jgi:hypothetical protein
MDSLIRLGDPRERRCAIAWTMDADAVREEIPKGACTPVVFLDGGVFGYSEVDAQGKGSTHLLELPEAGAAPRM